MFRFWLTSEFWISYWFAFTVAAMWLCLCVCLLFVCLLLLFSYWLFNSVDCVYLISVWVFVVWLFVFFELFVGFVLVAGYCFCFMFVVYLRWDCFVCIWLIWILLLLYYLGLVLVVVFVYNSLGGWFMVVGCVDLGLFVCFGWVSFGFSVCFDGYV